MHILGLLLLAVAKILHLVVNIYTFIIAGAVIISWVNADPYNPIVRFLYQATHPVFSRVRKIVPRALWRTGIDFTPILVFILLILIDTVAIGMIFDWAGIILSKR